jgi:hypothetical protein
LIALLLLGELTVRRFARHRQLPIKNNQGYRIFGCAEGYCLDNKKPTCCGWSALVSPVLFWLVLAPYFNLYVSFLPPNRNLALNKDEARKKYNNNKGGREHRKLSFCAQSEYIVTTIRFLGEDVKYLTLKNVDEYVNWYEIAMLCFRK